MNSREKIKIMCRNPKQFLKELINKKIDLYDIEINKKSLIVIINESDLPKIDKIKYIHKTSVVGYYGKKKIIYFFKKNNLFIISIIMGILINILLSNLIFSIEIETSNQKLKRIIEKDLKDNNIEKYHLKLTNKKKRLTKDKILSKEHNIIEWLEIVEQGTKYIIKVQERKTNLEEEKCYPRNIVAKKTATIRKISSSAGEIVKKENDFVEKNEVLISGLIYNKEKIVSKRCAIGKIYGEVWYNVQVQINENERKETLTNKSNYGVALNIFNKEFYFNNKYKIFQKKQYNIISSRIIPINISIVKYEEMKIINKKNNIQDIDEYAMKIATEKINNKLSNPKIINKKVLKKQLENSKIIVDIFFAVEEDITSYQDIREVDIEEIQEKKE